MEISEIIDFYYRTNIVDFDIFEKRDGYFVAFSKSLKDIYYNHVIPVGNTNVNELLLSTTPEFKKIDRTPAVCVFPISDFYNKEPENLKNTATDTWMRFNGSDVPKIDMPDSFDVRVIDQDYMSDYVDMFMRGFSGGVYGNLSPEYADVEKACFAENVKSPNKHIFSMAFYNEKPIGVVRATMEYDKAFIYAFAIPKEYRYSGTTAKLLGAFILKQIINRGGKEIFLQTEADTVLERFYRKNGFERLFLGKYYTGAL